MSKMMCNSGAILKAVSRSSLFSAVLVLMAGFQTVARCADDQKPATNQSPRKIETLKKQSDLVDARQLIDANGIKTFYKQAGQPGRGPEVFLLHGFGSSTFTWRKNLDALGQFAHVTAIDIKGFGLTEKPKDGQYHEAVYVRHVIDCMDALKIPKAVFIGSSMGGAIAARIALEHPERVSGLILVDAARPYTRLDFEAAGINTAMFKRKNSPIAIALVRTMIGRDQIAKMLRSVYEGREPVTDEMIDAYYVPTLMEGAPEALLAMVNPPVDPAPPVPLKNLKCPVTVVWGQKDNVIPVEAGERLAQDIPGAQLVIWHDAGHLPHEDRADDFNRLVQEFVEQKLPGRN